MKNLFMMLVGSGLLATLFVAVAVSAQTVPAAQVMGSGNASVLDSGLDNLGTTLVQLDSRLDAGNPPANPTAVNATLTGIRNTLLALSGTIAGLNGSSLAQLYGGTSTTPGLPNTGGGGASSR